MRFQTGFHSEQKPELNWSGTTTYKRTYYLNEKGEIYETVSKLKKSGIQLEGENYSKVINIYKEGLLVESHFYEHDNKDYYYMIKYTYEY